LNCSGISIFSSEKPKFKREEVWAEINEEMNKARTAGSNRK